MSTIKNYIYYLSGGLLISSACLAYYIYKKFEIYSYSNIIDNYIDHLKELILETLKKNNRNSNNKDIIYDFRKLPIEFYSLFYLINKQLVEEIYEENNLESEKNRIEFLKKYLEDQDDTYQTEVINYINIKEKMLFKAFESFISIVNKTTEELININNNNNDNKQINSNESINNINDNKCNFKMKFEISNKEAFYANICNLKTDEFKTFCNKYYIYDASFCDNQEHDFYTRLKVKIKDQNNYNSIFEFYINMLKNQSELIKDNKLQDNLIKCRFTDISNLNQNNNKEDIIKNLKNKIKKPYFSDNSKLNLAVNEVLMRDMIYLQFGIRFKHFVHIIENSDFFKKSVKLRMMYDDIIENKDRFLYY